MDCLQMVGLFCVIIIAKMLLYFNDNTIWASIFFDNGNLG